MQQKANTPNDNQKTMPRTELGSEAPSFVHTNKTKENMVRAAKTRGLIFIGFQ